MSDNELTEAQRRYYENLQNASPGTLSPTQWGNNLDPGYSRAVTRTSQGMLIEQSEARAKSARRWAWFWFLCFAAAMSGGLR